MLEESLRRYENHQLYAALIKQLNKDLGKEILSVEDSPESFRNKFLNYLSLPDTDIISILYRTDVEESQIPPNFQAEDLARLILERVWRKVSYRE